MRLDDLRVLDPHCDLTLVRFIQAFESSIEIREADTTYAEINAAACEIVRLVRDEGLRYREIGVACADLEGYTSLIRRAFANHNIPCFLDDRRQVSQHPAVDYILSLLKVGAYNWRKGDVLRMLKTGHANLPGGAVEKLQRYLSKLPGNRDYFYKREWKRPYEDFDLLEINDWRESFIKAPLKLFKRTKKGANGLEWAQFLYELLEDINMGDTLRAAEEQLKADGNIDLAAESTQVWNAVLELLDQMAIIMKDTVLTTSDVLQLLETGFRATKVEYCLQARIRLMWVILGVARWVIFK